MTGLMYFLVVVIPIVVLVIWVRKPSLKGQGFLVKLLLLAIPLAAIAGAFAHEGAFSGAGNLADLYAAVFISAFLFLYEVGMLIHYLYLKHKQQSTKEAGTFLTVGVLLLVSEIIYFAVAAN